MTAQIAGIGVGTFILFSIWIVALLLSLIAIRTKKLIGVIAITTASIVTLILLLIPIESKDTEPEKHKDRDYQFVWRNLLAAVLGLCSLASITVFVTEYCTDPLKTKPINSWLFE